MKHWFVVPLLVLALCVGAVAFDVESARAVSYFLDATPAVVLNAPRLTVVCLDAKCEFAKVTLAERDGVFLVELAKAGIRVPDDGKLTPQLLDAIIDHVKRISGIKPQDGNDAYNLKPTLPLTPVSEYLARPSPSRGEGNGVADYESPVKWKRPSGITFQDRVKVECPLKLEPTMPPAYVVRCVG